MHNRAVALTFAAATIAIAACGSDDSGTTTPTPVSKIVNLTATLTPAGEIGATLNGSPSGSGTFTATLDTSTNVFSYTATYTGLTSNVTLGHIHGPFALGGTTNSAGALLNFDPTSSFPAPNATFVKGATAGTATGTITLAAGTTITTAVNGDSLRKLILAGLTYVNIHTSLNGGGEIRGQLVRK